MGKHKNMHFLLQLHEESGGDEPRIQATCIIKIYYQTQSSDKEMSRFGSILPV